MPSWMLKLIWTGLLVLFTLSEAFTVGLTSIWFAAGSLAALICALLGGPAALQVGLFLVVSAVCLVAVRPLAKRYLNAGLEPTNADRVLHQEATVIEEIDNRKGTGRVRVGAMPWTARSESGETLPAGTPVRILRIEGAKVFVEPMEKEELK